jgi:hypothetical protein
MIVTIGNRNYLIEDEPLSQFKIHNECIVIHGNRIMKFMGNPICSGWIGDPSNKTYSDCSLVELNSTNSYVTGVRECYKILATDSKLLQKIHNLPKL